MKSHLITILAFTLLAGGSPAKSEALPRASSIVTRICQIDLDVALKHYEKLQIMLRETRLERDLQSISLGPDNPEVELATRKMEIIEVSLAQVRDEIGDLSARLEKIAPVAGAIQTR